MGMASSREHLHDMRMASSCAPPFAWQALRTRVVSGRDPVWDATLRFAEDPPGSWGSLQGTRVRFAMFDKDTLTKDNFIGEASLHCIMRKDVTPMLGRCPRGRHGAGDAAAGRPAAAARAHAPHAQQARRRCRLLGPVRATEHAARAAFSAHRRRTPRRPPVPCELSIELADVTAADPSWPVPAPPPDAGKG
jgi:hypothetical protein